MKWKGCVIEGNDGVIYVPGIKRVKFHEDEPIIEPIRMNERIKKYVKKYLERKDCTIPEEIAKYYGIEAGEIIPKTYNYDNPKGIASYFIFEASIEDIRKLSGITNYRIRKSINPIGRALSRIYLKSLREGDMRLFREISEACIYFFRYVIDECKYASKDLRELDNRLTQKIKKAEERTKNLLVMTDFASVFREEDYKHYSYLSSNSILASFLIYFLHEELK